MFCNVFYYFRSIGNIFFRLVSGSNRQFLYAEGRYSGKEIRLKERN